MFFRNGLGVGWDVKGISKGTIRVNTKLVNTFFSYRMRAIRSCGFHIFYPIFKDHFFIFMEFFSENSRAACNQERLMMARVRYITYSQKQVLMILNDFFFVFRKFRWSFKEKSSSCSQRSPQMSQHTNWVHLIPQDGRFNFKKKEEPFLLTANLKKNALSIRGVLARGPTVSPSYKLLHTFTTLLP